MELTLVEHKHLKYLTHITNTIFVQSLEIIFTICYKSESDNESDRIWENVVSYTLHLDLVRLSFFILRSIVKRILFYLRFDVCNSSKIA